MVFNSRADAGRKLGQWLRQQQTEVEVVVGLPRGGVVVAAEVALAFGVPLEVLAVRKIGHPLHREFAVGALAEDGVVVLDQAIVGDNAMVRSELDDVIEEEKARLLAYQSRFHQRGSLPLAGKAVVLVDDGLATGATTEAAVLSAKKQRARRVTVAAPVGSLNAVQRLERVADAVAVMWIDPAFDAVGRYYEVFSQTTDEEVLELLRAA